MHKSTYKHLSFAIICLIIAFTLTSCNKKDGSGDNKKTESEFIKTDASGQKVTLKMVPKVGDKFRYKMTAKTFSTEKSPATQNEDITSEQTMTYYYTQEVAEVNASGYITYKMRYDSIMIVEKAMSKDSTLTQTYNSNVKDSVSTKLDFVQYNALAGQEFKFRISPKGEIAEVIELEAIHDKIFKALGDTLNAEDKAKIKESMGSEALKSIIQNQYQKFPETDVYKDSTWTFSNETNLSVFPIKNILSYKLKDIKTEKNTIIEIEATLGIEFISKEEKQMGMTIKLMNEEAGGKGTVSFDLTKGCVVKKETNTNINMDLKLSAKGQSANSKQTLKTNLTVELL
ncbi:MAG: DUF6263 family protein [Ignavibacteria bacterium]|nr:DUF6263 family protein [Ignavibacteria bacterium]